MITNPFDGKIYHRQYLEDLEQLSAQCDYKDFYLWPRTPLGHDHQQIITRRIGASDYEIHNIRSRTARIIQQLTLLVEQQLIPESFSILDIACGDAIVLWQIKKTFPRASCYGIDCNKNCFGTHSQVQQEGVLLYNVFLQKLFQKDPFVPFNVVLMLNTYRGWESADLREQERDLPQLADAWFDKNAHYIVLTATKTQMKILKNQGFRVAHLGKGEDASIMICLSKQSLPQISSDKTWFSVHSTAFPVTIGNIRKIGKKIARRGIESLRQVGKRIIPQGPARTILHFAIEFPIKLVLEEQDSRDTDDIPSRSLTWKIFREYEEQLLPESRRMRMLSPDTMYIFVFLGEFGYELFNWQGVVRKLAQQLPASSQIVIGGRTGLAPFYENASQYIEISNFDPYRNSIAAGYFALPASQLAREFPPSIRELTFDVILRQQLINHLKERIHHQNQQHLEFVFSSHLTSYPGCVFGVDRYFYGRSGRIGTIYFEEEGYCGFLDNNVYKRIEPDIRVKPQIENVVGFNLERPYILVQTRHRKIGPMSASVSKELFIKEFARHMPVVFLSFNTGRLLDSDSTLKQTEANVIHYQAQSFLEQSCLIAYAHKCIFFTEGDLGSHTYLPPFMGKDVIVVAPQEVFNRSSAPITFWNNKVFRLGGQMVPWTAETFLNQEGSLEDAVKSLLF